MHLKLIPGTDAALAFGLLHVMREKGLVDEAFLEPYVLGPAGTRPAIEA